jgi:hypothetical protein
MEHVLVVPRDTVVDEWDLPSYGSKDHGVSIISDNIIDTSRWSVWHEIIVQIKDKFYQTTYSRGATEYQEESPWEGDETVSFNEVEKVQKLVDVWQLIATKKESENGK